jgi:hypothetical protein
MFLTLFFCLAAAGTPPAEPAPAQAGAGAGSCTAVVPGLPPFASANECLAMGEALSKAWLARHPGYIEGGMRCAATEPGR